MSDETYEVPIMLSEDIYLTYEDIAQLNPFYEENEDFCYTSSDTTASTVSSVDSSPRSSSSQSIRVGTNMSSSPVDVSSSPPLRNVKRYTGLRKPKLDVPLHEGKQRKPSVRIYDEDFESQHASFVVDGYNSHLLETINEATEMCDSDSIDLHPLVVKFPHKRLFGSNGWLGEPLESKETPVKQQKSGIFQDLKKKIKHHVGEIAEDVAKACPKAFCSGSRRPRIVPESTVPISLDPPTQATLYSEIEVMICVTANKFLVQQYVEGRISEESIKKVTNFWGSKNRPQVVEFQFDQATQRRLIQSNIRTLNFNGESSTNPILLHSNLRNWKAVAKEMSVRTFCAPDSAIRKHLHDIHKLLDMLDAHDSTVLAFEELQMQILALMKERRQNSYLDRTNSSFSGSSSRQTESSWATH